MWRLIRFLIWIAIAAIAAVISPLLGVAVVLLFLYVRIREMLLKSGHWYGEGYRNG